MAEVRTAKNPKDEKTTPAISDAPAKKESVKKSDLIVRARFIRNAPDKVRFVGKTLAKSPLLKAIEKLQFTNREAAKDLLDVLKNGLAQAKDKNYDEETLVIKSVAVNEGPKLKRRRIVHRGRATSILKRQSHVIIVLTSDIKRPKGVNNGS